MDEVSRRVSTTGLFCAPAPRIFTLSPARPFLRALAGQLALESDLRSDPAALADALIYVPNRRSARQLALELFDAAGAPGALLMPQIRALGDLDDTAAIHGAEAALADLPPPLDEPARLSALIGMVQAFHRQRGAQLPLRAALASARDLASLLDQSALSGGARWDRLSALVDDSELSEHWQHSVAFLDIVATSWPHWLAEQGAMEAPAYREAAARALAEEWAANPPAGPVVIAGSTGTTPAGRILMSAALGLAKGLVILPGLERDVPANDWAAMAAAPSHAQHAFTQALPALGLSPGDVKAWPGAHPQDASQARERLVSEALSPAELTGDWRARLAQVAGEEGEAAFTRRALAGLAVIEAGDEAEEARLAALVLRETLETPGLTAALVTPDAGLARRVSALLRRWELDVAPSSGTPLLHTPAGSAIALAFDWWTDPGDPVAIAALLRHGAFMPPRDPGAFERHVLRTARWWTDPGELSRQLGARLCDPDRYDKVPGDAQAAACAVADWLAQACPPDQGATLGGDAAVEAITALLDRFGAGETVWAGDAGRLAGDTLAAMAEMTARAGQQTRQAWADLYRALAAQAAVAPQGDGHPRLQIWGPLEARLQSADRLVLAGLNEGVWPQHPPVDAYLPRHFRSRIGLPDPEERMGLAAHDFAQLACQPNVTCLYSARRDDAPAVASRWIWRLKTLVRGALGEAAQAALSPPASRALHDWQAELRRPERTFDARVEPRPCPPLTNGSTVAAGHR